MKEIEIPLKCECGKVEGTITLKPADGNNVVCCCDDCQSFTHFLGKADTLLTPYKGTELFQVTPDKVKITQGHDQIACMQLSPKGLKRFYTKCCHTPVANTLGAKFAFNGIPHAFMDFKSMNVPKEKAIGPVLTHCMAKFAKGEVPKPNHPKFPFNVTLKIVKMLLLGRLSKKYQPNQFYDLNTGLPVAKPTIPQEKVDL
jgi:hypothetical protein